MKSHCLFSASVLLLVWATGCAGDKPQRHTFSDLSAEEKKESPKDIANHLSAVTVTNQLSPELLRPEDRLFTLGPGDVIEIEILGTALSRAVTGVGVDGKIYYQLLPGLNVAGLTLAQTRDLLEKELGKYMNSPQVTLSLRTVGSKFVWMLGRLNRPGIYPLGGPMTVLESIAIAGGTSRSTSQVSTEELADLRHSFIVRQGQLLPVDFYRLLREGDTSQNIFLKSDDFVYIPSVSAMEVYVLGAVRYPHVLPYMEQMSLLSAIAASAGPVKYDLMAREDGGPFMKDAYLSHVAIVRGSLATPQVMVADYSEIVKGRAPNIHLEPGDIIYVPNSPYTNLKRYVNLIVNTFVSTVVANEGIRAGGGTVGVGVSVPVH